VPLFGEPGQRVFEFASDASVQNLIEQPVPVCCCVMLQECSLRSAKKILSHTLPHNQNKEDIMKKHLEFVVIGLFILASSGVLAYAQTSQTTANQIIAREKASFEAWQHKDKAFFAEYLADDCTTFGPRSPYRDTEPKTNFLPKFEQYVEMFKILDFQMYQPLVQVYGDVAILSYTEEITGTSNGQPLNYTGKVTTVYVKQGGTWRVVHGHESVNPSLH
jgi:ketosteroid isomerase-like protein